MKIDAKDLLYWIRPDHWISLHIFYHTGDRSDLAVRLIYPTVKDLLYHESIEAFFFVRYSLGGPHIRLRLLPCPGKRESVRELVKRRSEQYLSAHPSLRALPDEEVRKQNLRLLGQDPNEQDETVYSDNTCYEIPFRPETERYGGTDLLACSLLFFALSSSRSLYLLKRDRDKTPSEWLAIALGLLRRLVLGFAVNEDELLNLAVVPSVANSKVTAYIVAKADRIFDQNRESLLRLVRQDIERLSFTATHFDDFEMATCLSQELRGSAAPIRHRILTSHLHMTANRLGLRNSDEIYLTRMLERSLAAIATSEPQYWSQLQRALVRRAAGDDAPKNRLQTLVRPSLAAILGQSSDPENLKTLGVY
jgi:hypothetical protein